MAGLQTVKLILGLSARRVAAEVAASTEVLPCPPWVGLPGLKPWLRGVAVYQSELLPVVDLSALLDARPLPGSATKKPMVRVSAGGFRAGFLVASVAPADAAEDVEPVDHETLETFSLEDLCLNLLADPQAVAADS